ncbi:MAG: hypothetical protein M5U19_12435 [Microthrixaceae bacterium]|nr:hypothetical protein [Microthrixaceae bacterium]
MAGASVVPNGAGVPSTTPKVMKSPSMGSALVGSTIVTRPMCRGTTIGETVAWWTETPLAPEALKYSSEPSPLALLQ